MMAVVENILRLEAHSSWETAIEAIRVWKERPNLVNRRLCGSSEIWSTKLKILKEETGFTDVIVDKVNELFPEFSTGSSSHFSDILMSLFNKFIGESGCSNPKGQEETELTADISIRKLLPRSLKKFKITLELVVTLIAIDTQGDVFSYTTWFIPFHMLDDEDSESQPLLSAFSYGLDYKQKEDKEGRFQLLTTNRFDHGAIPVGTLCANLDWLKEALLLKLKNWSETFKNGDRNPVEKKLHSLSLVDVERYAILYNEMKSKYAQPLTESWQENTDPQKFIFEDISIASYLIILWEEEQKENKLKNKQTFVDLGCGNGLLVYLLSKEGYKGCGIDIRRRKIWEQFGEGTKLLEQPLHPNSCKFDDADWIIGNHSDELTPWIPVIAARSSYKTKYFLLPCCFHDFTGKFTQNCPGTSQYQKYLEYISQIGEDCGFVIEHDIQRIPSTKRTCHIARKRTYAESEQETIDCRIQSLLTAKNCRLKLDFGSLDDTQNDIVAINENCSNGTPPCKDGSTFQPRLAKEKVRNCTQIDKDIKNHIVTKVFNSLIENRNSYGIDEMGHTSKGRPVAEWNCGGKLSMQEVTSLIERELLQELKCQCGGLQTLLKNHGHIFQVIKGEVSLKNYKNTNSATSQRKKKGLKPNLRNSYKTKLCYFHFNHPDGCILSDGDCHFAHHKTEIDISQ